VGYYPTFLEFQEVIHDNQQAIGVLTLTIAQLFNHAEENPGETVSARLTNKY